MKQKLYCGCSAATDLDISVMSKSPAHLECLLDGHRVGFPPPSLACRWCRNIVKVELSPKSLVSSWSERCFFASLSISASPFGMELFRAMMS